MLRYGRLIEKSNQNLGMVDKTAKCYLSICIPTRNRAIVLHKTLLSIFNSYSNSLDFEVVIYDSSDNSDTETMVKSDFCNANLSYVKGEDFGYLNLIEAMKLGSGEYLKLHNDYAVFNEGSIQIMIDEIEKRLNTESLLLFSNGSLRQLTTSTFISFDDFLNKLSFYSTWSNVFGMWNKDFSLLYDVNLNPMFPHTTLLFLMSDKAEYNINDSLLFRNIDIQNKGGYNLFHVFSKDYLGMVEACYAERKISLKTFTHIKTDMYYNFFIPWYSQTKILKNVYTFSLKNIKQSITAHYSEYEYFKMVYLAYKRSVKVLISNSLRKGRI
jgi:hypothetical protein